MTIAQAQSFRRWLNNEKNQGRWDYLAPHDHLPYPELLQAGRDFLEEGEEPS
jgi:hypothetical protein